MKLDGAIAFVTGGSGGLGAAICDRIAAEGVHVAVGYRGGLDRAEAVADRVRSVGMKALPVSLDQTDPDSVAQAVERVAQELGGIDILINNAAIAMGGHTVPPGDLDSFTPEIWDEMMTVNVRGPFLVARAAASWLRSSKWGRIVNIGSTLGHGAWYNDRAFAPSKGSVIPLTRFLAASLAPDVTVNCVSPGLMVETGLGRGGSRKLVDGWKQRSALHKTTSVHDVAEQVVSFCRNPSATGQSVVVDGGINFQ